MSAKTKPRFKQEAQEALADPQLQRALGNIREGFVKKRAQAAENIQNFEALRARARAVKDHTLDHLAVYLERFEAQVLAQGGQVHWCERAEDACETIAQICAGAGAKTITKGKSMVSEEIGLNAHLEAQGFTLVETDLGEYIIQPREETPSHIVAPALHLTKESVAQDFRRHHSALPAERSLDQGEALVAEARKMLREQFLSADVGITGANMLVAETGQTLIVTNEGNGDLTQVLPRTHIVLASIEKVVPSPEDALAILRVLGRSATGQSMSAYTTWSAGPRQSEDADGPEHFHVVLLDGGRSDLLASPARAMLRCIRCGACMNHCPVYSAIGGHAYGSTYMGPMGAVLSPGLFGIDAHYDLPQASSFCGRCAEVCPVQIPLPDLMRHFREAAFEKRLDPKLARWALALWAFLAKQPWLYRLSSRIGAACLRVPLLRRLPLARSWTRHRSLPLPEGGTFMAQAARSNRFPS